MQRSEFELLQEVYSKVNENHRKSHHDDGVRLTPREIKQIQHAINSNNILKGITKFLFSSV